MPKRYFNVPETESKVLCGNFCINFHSFIHTHSLWQTCHNTCRFVWFCLWQTCHNTCRFVWFCLWQTCHNTCRFVWFCLWQTCHNTCRFVWFCHILLLTAVKNLILMLILHHLSSNTDTTKDSGDKPVMGSWEQVGLVTDDVLAEEC